MFSSDSDQRFFTEATSSSSASARDNASYRMDQYLQWDPSPTFYRFHDRGTSGPSSLTTVAATAAAPSRYNEVANNRVPSSSFSSLPTNLPFARSRDDENVTGAARKKRANPDKVKTKLLSMWNNMKHGWTVRVKTNFSRYSSICLLGIQYHQKSEFKPSEQQSDMETVFREFQQDFYSRIWLTYRREFQVLDDSSLTTDCGWGCMLRSGQMLLAEGLVRHFLTRDWRWWPSLNGSEDNKLHRKIIRWFGDIPDENSPFALHHLVTIGRSMGKKAGDWYGPASVAHILKNAMENGAKNDLDLQDLRIYVAQDCTVYKEDVLDLCLGSSSSGAGNSKNWRGVIIFVPVRLGGEYFNSVYTYCVQSFLAYHDCIGIIGGRPRHSLYFVGWQDDKLIHLDPHFCQDVVDVSKEDFPLQTFHSLSPRKMAFSRMDPSCTIGFYCRTQESFNAFVKHSSEVVSKHSPGSEYPLFVVAEGHSDDCNLQHQFKDVLFSCHDYRFDSDQGSEMDSEEEFVMIPTPPDACFQTITPEKTSQANETLNDNFYKR